MSDDHNHNPNPIETGIPENFKKVITDFISSFLTTFPEYEQGLHSNLCVSTHVADEMGDAAIAKLHEHCRTVYPERFFDILYQNGHIFSPDSAVSNNVSVDFLPGIDFRVVWNLSDITDTTKEHIWKHLQLITFTIVGSMSKGNLTFGDTAKMFEAINEEELRVKLEETMANLQSMFEPEARTDAGDAGAANPNSDNTTPPPSASDALPDAESMHEHLSGLLGGKIGTLAKEIAEETVSELNIDVSEETSVSGVFQKLMKNPGKLAGIIKKVGEKLDKKMKSGDIKESELFKEASEFMSKMKAGGGGGKGKGGMGGMGDLAQILKSMNLGGGDLGGLGGMGGKTKVNLGAMQSQLGRNMKMAQNKERLQRKLEERRAAALVAAAASTHQQQQQHPKEMKHSVYKPSDGESIEKTPRNPTNIANQSQSIEPPPQLTQKQKKKHKKS